MNKLFTRLARETASPVWGIAESVHFSHQRGMRGAITGTVFALAVAAVSAVGGVAHAQVAVNPISNSTVSLGNVIILNSPAQIKVTAGGAVSVVSGSAVRPNGGAGLGSVPVQTVTIVCAKNGSLCNANIKVTITQSGVPAFSTLNQINITSPVITGSGSIQAGAVLTGAPGTQFFVISGGTNGWTVTFNIGSTVTLSSANANHTASWSYNVKAAP